MKKITLLFTAFIAIAFTSNSQSLKKATATIVATEEWNEIMDNNPTNYFSHIFEKNSEGVITTTTKSWQHVVPEGPTIVDSTPRTGLVTFDGTNLSFSVQGTATITSQGSTSTYSLSIAGVGSGNGTSMGTYIMSFTNVQWPGNLQGTWAGTKISGSGVTSGMNGIDNTTSDNQFILYPNPVTDAFSVKGIEITATITVSDVSGRVLISKEITSKETISVSMLPSGVYLTSIQSNNRTKTEKMIIQR